MKNLKYLLVATGLIALMAEPALAYEPGTFVLRGGVGTVDPKSNNLTVTDEIDEVRISVDKATNMTLTGTYLFSEKWAIDVLAAMPFKHDIDATMDIGGGPETVKIAETKQLPPTISIQYHFSPDGDFQPYVGLGLNWTTFSSTKFVPEMIDEEVSKMYIDDSFGVAAQLGGDWKLGDRMVLNFDVRWIDIDSDISIGGPAVTGKEKLGTVEIDPWVYSLNLGYSF
jgi:outer membrane protein